MVIDYKILEAQSVKDLSEAVADYLEQGWQPQGGVAITISESDDFRYENYAQAMVLIARRSQVVTNTREGLSVSGG